MADDKDTQPKMKPGVEKERDDAADPVPDDGGAVGGIDDPNAVGGGTGPDAEEK